MSRLTKAQRYRYTKLIKAKLEQQGFRDEQILSSSGRVYNLQRNMLKTLLKKTINDINDFLKENKYEQDPE